MIARAAWANRTAAWLGQLSVVAFLFENVKVMDSGVGYGFLAAAIGYGAFLVLARRNAIEACIVRRSALFLLAFVCYFILRLLLDFPDMADVKALTVGTTGGVLFALMLGTLCSIFIGSTLIETSAPRWALISTFIFLLTCLLLAWITFNVHIGSVRADRFIIDHRSLYQRPGNFLIMATLIASIQLARASAVRAETRALRGFQALNAIAYLVLVAVVLVTSQLIGSNTGLVVSAFLAIGTLIWIIRPRLPSLQWIATLVPEAVRPVQALRHSLPRFLFAGLVLLILAVLIGWGALLYVGLETQQIRIFGFSEQNIGHSLLTRIEILQRNFITQFAYSPIFGNANVDALTTGKGTYAHSLVSMLSHLGLAGTVLFVLYLGSAYGDLRRPLAGSAQFYTRLDFGMFRLMIASMFLLYALIGTFYNWMPMWFALGILCPPFLFTRLMDRCAVPSFDRVAHTAASSSY